MIVSNRNFMGSDGGGGEVYCPLHHWPERSSRMAISNLLNLSAAMLGQVAE